MVKKRWFVISIIELVVIIAIAAIFLCHNLLPSSYKEADLSENIIATSVGNTYDFGECGYIADANTAKRICSPIIDDMVGKDFIGLYDIEYDKENRLWCVSKYTLFEPGGAVVIEQDTGRVINARLYK